MSPAAPHPIRVLLVDDHPMFRAGLAAVLADATRFNIIGEAPDIATAERLSRTLQPDVIVMDLQLPDGNGLDAISQFAAQAKVLVVSMSDSDEAVAGALRAGAMGYLVKGASGPEFSRAIVTVAAGGAVLSQAAARRLSDVLSGAPNPAFPNLTQREREVLNLVACGYNNRRIAADLVLSEKTVRNHISHIFTKLDIPDRATAIVRARSAGMGTTTSPQPS